VTDQSKKLTQRTIRRNARSRSGGIAGHDERNTQNVYKDGTSVRAQDVVSDTGLFKDGDEVRLALSPFFQKLYDACGEERGQHMDAPLLALQG